jgi:hypothetical protein
MVRRTILRIEASAGRLRLFAARFTFPRVGFRFPVSPLGGSALRARGKYCPRQPRCKWRSLRPRRPYRQNASWCASLSDACGYLTADHVYHQPVAYHQDRDPGDWLTAEYPSDSLWMVPVCKTRHRRKQHHPSPARTRRQSSLISCAARSHAPATNHCTYYIENKKSVLVPVRP